MTKYIYNILKQKKIILILGIAVSLLILQQSDIYSSTTIQKIEPRYNAFKSKIAEQKKSETDDQGNLKNANFIATFFSSLSKNSSGECDENKKEGFSLQLMKARINEFVSTF